MDSNSDFEQQFTQIIRKTTIPSTATTNSSTDKLPLVIAIILAVITLVESIALVITLSNYSSIMGEETENYDVAADDEYPSASFTYDNNYNLVAADLTCTTKDGSYYNLDNDNKYTKYDSANSLVASGTYTITNDSLISLSDTNKVLYYDGFDIADGLIIYTCKEDAKEK